MSKHHIVYIPGLGDHRAPGQRRVIKLWRIFGVNGHFEPMLWRESEPLQIKLDRINRVVDGLLAAGDTVSLVAVSAGASAALNIFAQRKHELTSLVLICGKVHNGNQMHPSVVRNNNAFGKALDAVPGVLKTLSDQDRRRIMSVHPMTDESVPIADTRIPGTIERTIPVRGHAFGIAYGITIYMPIIAHFLKRQAKRSR